MAELKKKATRESYGEALAELGDKYDNLYVFDADLAAATKTGIFKKKFPDRFFDCGIAESNMMGVAAGMAATGKIPFASTFAMFYLVTAVGRLLIHSSACCASEMSLPALSACAVSAAITSAKIIS